MVVGLSKYKSHPDKKLLAHANGVVSNAKELTSLNLAEIAAIFHDVGKINPNFQAKVKGENSLGYSNHAYLSSYIFWCYYCVNYEIINKKFNITTKREILQVVTLIAKHHGNLPNFIPSNRSYLGSDYILNEEEIDKVFKFLNDTEIPADGYIQSLLPGGAVHSLLKNFTVQSKYKDLCLSFEQTKNEDPLDFFLKTQFSFASLILADKRDAGGVQQNDRELIDRFCKDYNRYLDKFLKLLESKQDIPINKLRTQIREGAVNNLSDNIEGRRVFTLTAPTGSGKTLTLLSLAGEIIKQKGNFRIIYSLPFLSITEQVEKEVSKIFEDSNEYIRRVDSKSESKVFQRLQEEIEVNPTSEKIRKLLNIQFQGDTFSYPFIITTFVRFFETLLSNRNAALLKLPNFAKSIFLIDEIQALPPRLYSFFIAFLSEFCKQFDSYAIISTATMPYTKLPHQASNYSDIEEIFHSYEKPIEVSDYKYFSNALFKRYTIKEKEEAIVIEQLAEMIKEEDDSILIILNTIDDTKNLYRILENSFDKKELILLNTHFTPNDRRIKIKTAKNKLADRKKVIVISTQLVEAGVDIDFPILYRDMATMSSIIQAAGRCNRNGNLKSGKVVVFNLQKEGKQRAKLIYRGKDAQLLRFTKRTLDSSELNENELFELQKSYFTNIGTKLDFGKHKEIDFIKEIKKGGFENIGFFKLIDSDFYGEEFTCYIPSDKSDQNFKILKDLAFKQGAAFETSLEKGLFVKSKIKDQMKKMSGQILQVRIRPEKDVKPLHSDEVYDIHLVSRDYYSYEKGISLSYVNTII
jgi:CRISPR-associated endonuclease/helicase Cas3